MRKYIKFGRFLDTLDGSGLGFYSLNLLERGPWSHHLMHLNRPLKGDAVPLLYLTLNGVTPL